MFSEKQFAGETAIIKIGSSALCRADGHLDEEVIAARLHEIAEAKKAGAFILLVTSGATNLGRALCGGDLQNASDMDNRRYASVGQAALVSGYGRLLGEHGIAPAQILVSHANLHEPEKLCETLASFRDHPFILPVVNENDTMPVRNCAPMFRDNDELAGKLAIMLSADRFIILSDIAGIYGVDRKVIPIIDVRKDSLLLQQIAESGAHITGTGIGRGEIAAKLAAAEMVAREGIPVHVANSRAEAVIANILSNGSSTGTKFIVSQLREGRREVVGVNVTLAFGVPDTPGFRDVYPECNA